MNLQYNYFYSFVCKHTTQELESECRFRHCGVNCTSMPLARQEETMTYRILILGASYGSLFGTKCLMAGHDVSLVCRSATAALFNAKGATIRLPFKGETAPRTISSLGLPGRLDARAPEAVDPTRYDLVVLAMQEPQYADPSVADLLSAIGAAGVPCLSLMNMPPLAYLKRLVSIDTTRIGNAYADASVWDAIDPQHMTLCSPDPQAFRPADEPANILVVGLATNFKAATFATGKHNRILETLADDIDGVRLDGAEVPVRLRVHASPYVPLAKWAMLMTGNYRCITVAAGAPTSIRDAVHSDIDRSREIYSIVELIAKRIGARDDELVPFDKYAAAAERLVKPSSAARAITAGATTIERVDKLIQLIGRQFGITHPAIDHTVALIDAKLARNARRSVEPGITVNHNLIPTRVHPQREQIAAN
jgi:hypothetical protein